MNWSLHPPLKKRTTPLWMFLTSSQENEKKYKIGSIMCVTTFNVKLGCVKHQTSCKILDFWASILHGRGYWQEPFRSIIPYWLAQFRPKFPISIDWNITNKSCTSQIEKKNIGGAVISCQKIHLCDEKNIINNWPGSWKKGVSIKMTK